MGVPPPIYGLSRQRALASQTRSSLERGLPAKNDDAVGLVLRGRLIRYPGHTDIALSIQLGHTIEDGMYEANLYDLRFPVTGETGNFPARTIPRQGEECRYFGIDPALMQQAEN